MNILRWIAFVLLFLIELELEPLRMCFSRIDGLEDWL